MPPSCPFPSPTGIASAMLAGLLVLVGCATTTGDTAPRLLSPQELRAEVARSQAMSVNPTVELEQRAASLRGRAASLRAGAGTDPETDALRRRAQDLTDVAR